MILINNFWRSKKAQHFNVVLVHSHINSSVISSLPCGRPFYGVSFGYWGCDEIDFEESN